MPELHIRKIPGSLVTTLPREDVVPGDFSDLENFVFDADGLPKVRGGRKTWSEGVTIYTEYVLGLYHFESSWVSRRSKNWLIAYTDDGKIYKAEMDGTMDEIMDGYESDLSMSFTALAGNAIWAGRSRNYSRPYYWNGRMDEPAKISSAPPANILTSHANRLWVVSQDEPSKICYSAPYEPTLWDAGQGAGYIFVAPGDGNEISAIVPGFAGEMIIFKDGPSGGATYRLQGSSESDFVLTPLSSTLGAVNHRCATLVGDKDIMFCSRRGIHSLRRVFEHGDLESAFIDAEVSNKWRDLPLRAKRKAVAVDDYPRDTWWLSYDDDGDNINDRCLLFNYRHQTSRGNPKISEMSHGIHSGAVVNDNRSGLDKLLTGGYEYVWEEHREESQDDTEGDMSDYSWEAVLQPIDAGDAFTMKAWHSMWLLHDNWGEGEYTVEWYGDNRYPTSSDHSMNPADFPTPFKGYHEFRMQPDGYSGRSLIHLREGGTRLTIGISGTRGRTKLRGMKIKYRAGKEDITADRWLPYTQTRHG